MSNPELLTGIGAALSIFLSSAGSCIASAPAGIFALRSTSLTSFGPIVIAGVLAIYGLIVSVILTGKLMDNDNDSNSSSMTDKEGYKNLSAGLSVGLACLASGIGMSRFIEHSMCCGGHGRGRGRGHSHGHEHEHGPGSEACRYRSVVTGTTTESSSSESEIPLIPNQVQNGVIGNSTHFVKTEFTFRFFMVMVYLEAIGLYGLIVAVLLVK